MSGRGALMHETNFTRVLAVGHRVGAKEAVVSWGLAFGLVCLSRLSGPCVVEPCHKALVPQMSHPFGIDNPQLCSLDTTRPVRSSSGDLNCRVQLSERAAAAPGYDEISTNINLKLLGCDTACTCISESNGPRSA